MYLRHNLVYRTKVDLIAQAGGEGLAKGKAKGALSIVSPIPGFRVEATHPKGMVCAHQPVPQLLREYSLTY